MENQAPIIKPTKPIKKKRKRKKKIGDGAYLKNICGYITKKCIKNLVSPLFKDKVQEYCKKYNASYICLKNFYLGKFEKITGPSHMPELLVPITGRDNSIKYAFHDFFLWFLEERYLREFLVNGKMSKKLTYIRYKNTVLKSIL